MRPRSLIRLMAIGPIAAGLIFLSNGSLVRGAAAQTTATATLRSTVTPVSGLPTTYTVQTGDSFNAIARRFNLTPQELQALNGITQTGVIRVGQVLIVAVNTLTPEPTETMAPTTTATAAPTSAPTDRPTATPTDTPTIAPTGAPTEVFIPTPTFVPEPQAVPAPSGIPADVIVVGVIVLLAIVGIVIGFRTQHY